MPRKQEMFGIGFAPIPEDQLKGTSDNPQTGKPRRKKVSFNADEPQEITSELPLDERYIERTTPEDIFLATEALKNEKLTDREVEEIQRLLISALGEGAFKKLSSDIDDWIDQYETRRSANGSEPVDEQASGYIDEDGSRPLSPKERDALLKAIRRAALKRYPKILEIPGTSALQDYAAWRMKILEAHEKQRLTAEKPAWKRPNTGYQHWRKLAKKPALKPEPGFQQEDAANELLGDDRLPETRAKNPPIMQGDIGPVGIVKGAPSTEKTVKSKLDDGFSYGKYKREVHSKSHDRQKRQRKEIMGGAHQQKAA